MADAEIIPLGTRGRPGRGTGKQRPSAAARRLAGPVSGPVSGPTAGQDAPETEPTPGPDVPAARPAPAKRRTVKKAAPAKKATGAAPRKQPPPKRTDAAPQTRPRPVTRQPVTTQERVLSALGGIPVGDWLGALESGAREVLGEQWERRLAELMAFWRRRLAGDYTVDEFGFDAEITERLMLAVLRPIAQKWFRLEVRGLENLPRTGGALVVSNHSGTVPVDGLMTMSAIYDHTGRHLRALGADLVFQMPIVSSIARSGGATLACNDDAERLLRGGELVGVWPEGFKGIGKPWSERYRLQRFGRGGFVSAALRTGVPIIPLSVVGAEEIYPIIGNLPTLARLLGVPYLPITPFFPWLGPLGLVPLPSKWLIEFGEPIRTDEFDEGAAEDPMLVFDVTDQVRESIQQTLFRLLDERGPAFG